MPEVKRRDADCGSPFGVRITSLREASKPPLPELWLLSFGEAEKSDSPAGDPGTLEENETLQNKEQSAYRKYKLSA